MGPPALMLAPKPTNQFGSTAIVVNAKPACVNRLMSLLNSCLYPRSLSLWASRSNGSSVVDGEENDATFSITIVDSRFFSCMCYCIKGALDLVHTNHILLLHTCVADMSIFVVIYLCMLWQWTAGKTRKDIADFIDTWAWVCGVG